MECCRWGGAGMFHDRSVKVIELVTLTSPPLLYWKQMSHTYFICHTRCRHCCHFFKIGYSSNIRLKVSLFQDLNVFSKFCSMRTTHLVIIWVTLSKWGALIEMHCISLLFIKHHKVEGGSIYWRLESCCSFNANLLFSQGILILICTPWWRITLTASQVKSSRSWPKLFVNW